MGFGIRFNNGINGRTPLLRPIKHSIVEKNHHGLDPLISNAPVPLEELDIRLPNFFMLWYFSNITKSLTIIEVRPTDLAQSENNKLLIEQPVRDKSNLLFSESTYKNREILPEMAVNQYHSHSVGVMYSISEVLRKVHSTRLYNLVPANLFYPDLPETQGVIITGLGTTAKSRTICKPGTLPFDTRNFKLPNTNQYVNINLIFVETLSQFLLEDGANYYDLQERIGDNFSIIPSDLLMANQELMPVRVFLPTASKNHILVQDRFLPVKFLYDEKFYVEAHQAGLCSGTEAMKFCTKYITVNKLELHYQSQIEAAKIDNVIRRGVEDFAQKDKVKNQKFTDIHPYPSKPDTE